MEAVKVNEKNYFLIISKYVSIGIIVFGMLFALWGYHFGIFKNQEAFRNFIHTTGIWAPLIFIFIQLIQVIIPILPGFVTCIVGAIVFGPVLGFFYSYLGMCIGSILAFFIARKIQVIIPILPGFVTCIVGAIVFGPVLGFFYSYLGMCIGSILAFFIARKYGTACVKKMIGDNTYEKYIGWLEKGEKFTILFALAIFLPAAPDDILCFIAGLTKMKTQTFLAIILLGKPFVILLYSLAFALAIFLPAAPDDILCFIAGLTKMKTQTFLAIILLGKPFVILLYSLAVAGIITLPSII